MRSVSAPPHEPAEILLLRHAATSWNDQRRRLGWSDQPLTPAGRKAASDWATRWNAGFAAVCCSDLERASSTARIVAAAMGLGEVETVSELREQNQGDWTGLTKEEIKLRWPERLRERPRRPVGGESPEGVLERVLAALATLAAAHSGQRVLAVTHSVVIRTVERAIAADAPPVPHLEGRWLNVRAQGASALGASHEWLSAGELTGGRLDPHGTIATPLAAGVE